MIESHTILLDLVNGYYIIANYNVYANISYFEYEEIPI